MHFLQIFALVAGLANAEKDLLSVLKSQNDLSTLLKTLELVPALGKTLASASDITILAPTNSAFENVPPNTEASAIIKKGDPDGVSSLLSYHVLGGKYPASAAQEVPAWVPSLVTPKNTVNGVAATNVTGGQNVGFVLSGKNVFALSGELQASKVTEADIMAKGGVIIHKIDKVLTIPLNVAETAPQLGATAALGAFVETDLSGPLDTVKDLTIFVPSNDAFRAAGSAFQGASVKTLTSVLEYHAVVGSVLFSTDLSNTTVKSYGGTSIEVSVVDGTAFVNSARVILPNILLSNGVAHVIDAVLNPADNTVNRGNLNPTASPKPEFPGASSVPKVPFTSAAPSVAVTVTPAAAYTGAPAIETTSSSGGGNDNSAPGISGKTAAAVTVFSGILATIGALLL